MGGFDNVWVEITCPECGQVSRKTLGWLKKNHRVTCPSGHVTELDTGAFQEELGVAERDYRRLERDFQDLKERLENGDEEP